MNFFNKLPVDLQVRLGGVFFAGLSVSSIYFSVIKPLLAARNHEPYVFYSPEIAAIAPFMALFGLLLMVLGARVEGVFNFLGRHRILAIGIVVFLVVLALLLLVSADQIIRVFGYS